MFTGIVEETGNLLKIVSQKNKKYLTISCEIILDGLKLGDSISTNGICLTVVEFTDNSITVEAMRETILKTTIKNWKINDQLNLERAMLMNGRLDGHIVQGHVDSTIKLINRETLDNTLYLDFLLDKQFYNLVVEHGSIALNGVSLTIAKLSDTRLSVALIGFTKDHTNLKNIKIGEEINVEFDILGKYILRNLNMSKRKNISEEWLIEKGF